MSQHGGEVKPTSSAKRFGLPMDCYCLVPYNSHSLAIPSAADGDALPVLHRPPREFELPRDSLSLLETEVSDACDLGDGCRDEQHADGHCGDEYLLLLQQHVVLVLLAGDAITTTTANRNVRAVSHTP